MSTAIVNITSSAPGAALPSSLGADVSAQLVHAVVSVNAESRAHRVAIVNAHLSSDERCRMASDLLVPSSDASIAFLTADSQGYATVICDSPHCNAFAVAAAVVVYKASWGWDETAQMSTRVNDREIRASAKFDETNWIVQE